MLEDIIARGNRGHRYEQNNRVVCADGFNLSVIAGGGSYCDPRPALCAHSFTNDAELLTSLQSKRIRLPGEVPCDFPGPYNAVEIGFPSEKPEPWSIWSVYAEDENNPEGTVYGYVPVEAVRALVESHGGEAGAQD